MRSTRPSQVVFLIESMFPDAKRQEKNPESPKFIIEPAAAPRVASIVQLIKDIPEHLIRLDGESYTVFLASLGVLDIWALNGGYGQNLFRIAGLTNDNPLTTLLKLLRECPDEYPSPESAGLDFVDDEELRATLRLDLDATEQGVRNHEWKAATVIGGSLVEALLLWKLSTQQKEEIDKTLTDLKEESPEEKFKPSGELENWALWQYIKVAEKMGVISKNTATQAKLTKNFRNLIHPGKALRAKEVCNRSTALTALAAAIRIIDEFGQSAD